MKVARRLALFAQEAGLTPDALGETTFLTLAAHLGAARAKTALADAGVHCARASVRAIRIRGTAGRFAS